MEISELGEFGLIERITKIIGGQPDQGLILGIGDDAAAWNAESAIQLATTDSLIQDVHFTFRNATWRELGWKALAINISDIAAMGGIPRRALLSLGLPSDAEISDIEELCRGLKEIADEYDVQIVGGNVSSASVVMINVSLIGTASDSLLTRSNAVVGEKVAVIGYLGQSAAGLKMLNDGLEFDPETTAFLRNSHLCPHPLVTEGQILVECGVKTAIDLSDGLLSDLGHICNASNTAARLWIDKLPIHPMVLASFSKESLKLALSGGEDYGLLFTANTEILDKVYDVMSTRVAVIGEVESGETGQMNESLNNWEWIRMKFSGSVRSQVFLTCFPIKSSPKPGMLKVILMNSILRTTSRSPRR